MAPRQPGHKRHATIAEESRWRLLGELLEGRRQELGYRFRPAFARDRLPPTPDGNENTRLVADIEKAYPSRINTFPVGTLRLLAQAYQVTYESVIAVLNGKEDELEPARPAPPPVLPSAPPSGLLREDAVRPWAEPVWKSLRLLSARGVRDPDGNAPASESWSPSGAQLGLAPGDAKVWDGSRGAMSVEDQAWLVGDIRRRREARDAGREPGASSA